MVTLLNEENFNLPNSENFAIFDIYFKIIRPKTIVVEGTDWAEEIII